MPPMPGQSRSLLHFTPTTQIKREIDAVNVDAIKQEKADSVDGGDVVTTVTQVVDHDYFVGYSAPSTAPSGPTPAKRAKISILTPSQNKPFVVKEVRLLHAEGFSFFLLKIRDKCRETGCVLRADRKQDARFTRFRVCASKIDLLAVRISLY